MDDALDFEDGSQTVCASHAARHLDVSAPTGPRQVLGRALSRLDAEQSALSADASSVHVSHSAHLNQTSS